jgi:hypothetical protein
MTNYYHNRLTPWIMKSFQNSVTFPCHCLFFRLSNLTYLIYHNFLQNSDIICKLESVRAAKTSPKTNKHEIKFFFHAKVEVENVKYELNFTQLLIKTFFSYYMQIKKCRQKYHRLYDMRLPSGFRLKSEFQSRGWWKTASLSIVKIISKLKIYIISTTIYGNMGNLCFSGVAWDRCYKEMYS